MLRQTLSQAAPATAARLALAVAALLALGGCPPKYPACKGDRDCRANEFCVNNECQQCRNSQDCKNGEICKAGRCEAPKVCTDDGECPSGQSCIDGKCKPCASDNECGPGGKCQAGKCQRAKVQSTPEDGEAPPATGPCQLEAVYFDLNESQLSSDASAAIDRNVDCLKKAGKQAATLTGHTDPRGTDEYNIALSERRALSVRERMGRLGVDAGRLKTVAKGKMEATGTDESGWTKDRRVDVAW